jgi:sentrin-specific protease 8
VCRYLEYVVFKDYAAAVCFLTPDVAQFIKLYEGHSELEVFLEPLCLHDKKLVVLAINNNQSTDHGGGSHWSTLVYWREGNTFEYYDSAGSMNNTPARLCSNKLIHFLRVTSPPSFKVVDCPQQEN